jgi:hypothetical protein
MGQRLPPVYNTSATNVTVVASFTAKGLSKTPAPGAIHWSCVVHDYRDMPATPATCFLSPSADGKSCIVQLQGAYTGHVAVDVTCEVVNGDHTAASETVTIVFNDVSVDTVSLSCTG